MSLRIIKLFIGIILIYGFGWLTHRRSSIEVPKYIAFIFGKRINKLNPVGIAFQVIALIYLLATLIGILQRREDLINFYAFCAIFLACLIYLIISGMFARKNNTKKDKS